ncbi:hypothetical protein, partial [Xanthovirga aplysinae]|uniref:hypothetical protein n=1 Tax=Xanthovirga aplysinae TaxID=2529853 RepID=UPI001CA40159
VIGYLLLKFFSNTNRMEWGHHFSFEKELGIIIDSLEITVGDVKTIILAGLDSLRALEGNIDVPKKGYPHQVTLIIYSNEKQMIFEADSFDCFNCEGNHKYKLKESGAEYKFLN